MTQPPRAQPKRAWQRMLSGRVLDLIDPFPLDIEIEDIAHGLSRVARWNGQTIGEWPFSVAEHSLLVDDICCMLKPKITRQERMIALLHDGPEYVIGDMISPFKAVVGGDYKALESRLLRATFQRFSLPVEPSKATMGLVKRADRASAYLEAVNLAGFSEDEARKIFNPPPGIEHDTMPIIPLPPNDAKARFLDRFNALFGGQDC
ncbi:MAG: HD family hydrolase [Neomegalonema sp.]|nr:HD family hydrolase [Neomegalonema sp.]